MMTSRKLALRCRELADNKKAEEIGEATKEISPEMQKATTIIGRVFTTLGVDLSSVLRDEPA
jgi:hypothetical protein